MHAPHSRSAVSRFALLAGLLALAPALPAAISVEGWWRLGEADTGVSDQGAGASTTNDSASTRHLTKDPSGITYSTSVLPPSSQLPLGASTISMFFNGNGSAFDYQGFSTSVFSTVTDNFGLEAWIRTESTVDDRVILFNGTGGSTNGYGLVQNGLTISARNGTTSLASFTIQQDVWTHVAMVRDNGTTTFYVNGASVGTSASAPSTPLSYFSIGMAAGDSGGRNYYGYLDEARFFTFSAGEFSTSDLNYSAVPESATWAAAAGVAALAAAALRRRKPQVERLDPKPLGPPANKPNHKKSDCNPPRPPRSPRFFDSIDSHTSRPRKWFESV